MFISHIAIYTNDLERLKDFYIRFFSGKSNEKYKNNKTGLETYFISFDSGTRLELMQRPDIKPAEMRDRSEGLTHLAFSAGTRENVDALTRKLVEAGYTLHSAPRVTGDGYYESSVLDPDSNIIEITD
ncbi:MAG: glyoxalase [Eubacterium sp.]|nr:glyoxalase [Eubacterium sp.]